MPRKYEGEPEKEPDYQKALERIAREVNPFLKADPKPIKEILKHRGKPEPMKPEDIKEFWKQREDRKKQTFKCRPMA